MYIKTRSRKKLLELRFGLIPVQGIGSKCPKFDV